MSRSHPGDRAGGRRAVPRRRAPDLGGHAAARVALGRAARRATAAATSPSSRSRLPFDHPLYIMYSSGTTGLPKCMVHGAGGTLLQHLKELVLHTDLARDDRIFYFTTCGWMMWNWLVSRLAVGATVVLYDGAPLAPRRAILWDMAAGGARHGVRHQRQVPRARREGGARAARDARPRALADHPLHRQPARGAQLRLRLRSRSSATSTSRASAAAPTSSPASRSATRSGRSGAASCRCAGSAWRSTCSTTTGGRCAGEPGELVCTRPFPSMPVAFWNDPDGAEVPRGLLRRTSRASGATATGPSSRSTTA